MSRALTNYPGDPPIESPGPCAVCGGDTEAPVLEDGACICPECPLCGLIGEPRCYERHGLIRTQAQIDGRAAVEHAWAAEVAGEEAALASEEDPDFDERQAEAFATEQFSDGLPAAEPRPSWPLCCAYHRTSGVSNICGNEELFRDARAKGGRGAAMTTFDPAFLARLHAEERAHPHIDPAGERLPFLARVDDQGLGGRALRRDGAVDGTDAAGSDWAPDAGWGPRAE